MEKTCFIIMPFGGNFDDYYKLILKPTISDAGYRAMRADDVYSPGIIIDSIVGAIKTSNIILADVSSKNPNVNYELGMAHILEIPTILITNNKEDVPFDYRHRRYYFYDTQKVSWQENLKDYIKKALFEIDSGKSDSYILKK